MTRDTEKCSLSVLTGVRIKRVNFRENIWAFCGDKRNCPYKAGVGIKRVSVERGSTVLKFNKRKRKSVCCSKTNGEVKPFMTADFLGTFFFNLFDCRFVFAPSWFTDTRLVRTPHYYEQFALSLGRGKPLYGPFLWPLRVHIKVVFFTTSAWLKSISFKKISDYFLLLLLLLLTSFADGVARNLPPCQWNNIS